MVGRKRFGVALSGGGYRAAGFHIGTLKTLHKLQLLDKVDVLSTISGGSITGAAYCLHQGNFLAFEAEMIEILSTKSVIKYVLGSWLFLRAALPSLITILLSIYLLFTKWAFCSIFILGLFFYLLIRFQFKLFPLSRIIEKAYNRFFFSGETLEALCDRPELAIGSTNLQTMRHFTFSKRKMEDSVYAYYPKPILFDNKGFPISRAVMASTCVPFAFTPVYINAEFFKDPNLASTVKPMLVDGGVYDNQGVHKITQNNSSYACDIVLVSDAGNKVPFDKSYNNTFTLLLRTVETFMVRIKNFQMIQNIYNADNKREVAYQSLGWDLEGCVKGFYDNLKNRNISSALASAHNLQEEWIDTPHLYKEAIIKHLSANCNLQSISANSLSPERLSCIRQIGTNLTVLKAELIKDMIVHAENLTELQLRLYCPSLFSKSVN
ncbi:patatin-like phospholipase family protein [Mucilaginibacter lacusdianchii]|uniref:patatin-like phospholipase family protein n=1 Tax=Mucilaginibacter lacusdianchii TaxID=2684211 RepID=UPI00131B24EC|nr:patatin-like phospholipase family protein [Mucilaginibacter sp. JXJ CY 39]